MEPWRLNHRQMMVFSVSCEDLQTGANASVFASTNLSMNLYYGSKWCDGETLVDAHDRVI